VKKILD